MAEPTGIRKAAIQYSERVEEKARKEILAKYGCTQVIDTSPETQWQRDMICKVAVIEHEMKQAAERGQVPPEVWDDMYTLEATPNPLSTVEDRVRKWLRDIPGLTTKADMARHLETVWPSKGKQGGVKVRSRVVEMTRPSYCRAVRAVRGTRTTEGNTE